MALILGIVQVVSTLATLVIVILVWKQLRLIREQIDLVRQQATTSFEDSLTEHYRRIMESIPTNIWLGAELKTIGPDRRNLCENAIYRYIDLCQDQIVLCENGRITKETWNEWSAGIRVNMTKLPAFIEVWREVKEKRTESFTELKKFLSPQNTL